MRYLGLWLWLLATAALGAGKDYVPGYTLVSATAMTADITSASIDARAWDNVDIQIVAAGSPTGTFAVDCSLNGPQPPASAAPVWVPLTLSPAPAVTGSASNIVIELNQTGCQYLRVRYVATSGTGTLTVYASEKQL